MSDITAKKPKKTLNFFKREIPSNLVLKLAPNHWLLADVAMDRGRPFIKKLIQFPLPRQVDPNKPNLDLEILQDTLIEVVNTHSLEGRDVSFLLPSSSSSTQTYLVPFDLEKKAEIKEFQISLQEKEFWQEFDSEVQDIKQPVFGAQYIARGDEEGSSHVLASWSSQELLNKYIDLALSAQLNPVAMIPEVQGVLNLLLPQLERLEREGFFGLLHIARGRSKLLAVGPERIISAAVNISELDEELLDEIESISDISGEFWEEVGLRVDSALKQAVLYLREQEGIPTLRNIYVISEASKFENMLSLLKANFNLGTLKSWLPLNQVSKNSLETISASSVIPNQTIWASLIGGGLQGLRPEKLNVPSDQVPRYQLNLHPQRKQLFDNRQYRDISTKANWGSFAVVSLFATWFLFSYLPDYLQYNHLISPAQSEIYSLEAKKQELTALNTNLQSTQAQVAILSKADKDASKSKFALTLPSLLPNGVELNGMSVNDSNVVVKGVAINNQGAQTLFNNINQSRLVYAPLLKMERPEQGRISFSIEGQTGVVN